MNDTIYTGLAGYQVSKISQLGKEMFELHRVSEADHGLTAN